MKDYIIQGRWSDEGKWFDHFTHDDFTYDQMKDKLEKEYNNWLETKEKYQIKYNLYLRLITVHDYKG